jgi:hypothetical protein
MISELLKSSKLEQVVVIWIYLYLVLKKVQKG